MAKAVSRVISGSLELPALFAPDQDAARRFIEFFTANIRNPNTRRAYARAAGRIRRLVRGQTISASCGYRAGACRGLYRDAADAACGALG